MATEYRFSMTPRLVALALFAGIALMALLFALGYQVGHQMATQGQEGKPGKLEQAADRTGERALRQLDKAAASAVAPLAEPAKAVPKALP